MGVPIGLLTFAGGKHVANSLVVTWSALVVAFAAAELVLLWLAAHRTRWALITFVVLTVLGWLSLLSNAGSTLNRGAAHLVLVGALTAAEVIGVVLLLRLPSRAWYGSSREH